MKLIVHEVGITLHLTVDELSVLLGFDSREVMHEHYGRGTQAIANVLRDAGVDVEVTED